MACTVERRMAQLEQLAILIEPFQIVLRFVDPARVNPVRVVVLEVSG